MKKRQIFFRIRLLKNFLANTQQIKQQLLSELIANATDSVVSMRRYRMLSQLSLLESQLIEKIQNIDTDCEDDFKDQEYLQYVRRVINRNG